MHIRFAMLAGVTAVVAAAAMVTAANADQHLHGAVGNTMQTAATSWDWDQPCGCGDDLKKRQDELAEKERVDKERKLVEGELKEIRSQLAATQQLQSQKDVLISNLKRQLTMAQQHQGQTDAQLSDLQRLLATAQQLNGQKDIQITDLQRQLAAKPIGIKVTRPPKAGRAKKTAAVQPMYHYGPYEIVPPPTESIGVLGW
jgi:chromosome segregation ATPase